MRNVRTIQKLILAACAASTIFAGCAEPEGQPGTVIVDWEIVIGCSVAGVETVEARLVDKESHLAFQSYDSASTSCVADEPIIFAAVPPGRYDVIIEGFNAEGAGTYLSASEAFTLSPGATKSLPVLPLSQKRGAIDVKWAFGNGELCAANQVRAIQLSILDETSSQLYEEDLLESFPCDPYSLTDEERMIGVDYAPEELNGILIGDLIAGEHFIFAYGLDENGEKVRKGMFTAGVELGSIFEGKLILVSCDSEEYPNMDCE